jgi:micrococcal nuclease
MNVKLILAILALSMMVPQAAFAHPNEASGIVRRVIDGCTFEVEGFGIVSLADLSCPPMGTADGVHSREYSMERLLNVQVFLDVDDNAGNGCVAYLHGKNGNPKLVPCYNRMIVDAGYAWVSDDADNEFNPQDWWNATD